MDIKSENKNIHFCVLVCAFRLLLLDSHTEEWRHMLQWELSHVRSTWTRPTDASERSVRRLNGLIGIWFVLGLQIPSCARRLDDNALPAGAIAVPQALASYW